jgi:hypothetical protein
MLAATTLLLLVIKFTFQLSHQIFQ